MALVNSVSELYKHRNDFIIIGLTGRTGSGCSTIARILSRDVSELQCSVESELLASENEKRKHRSIVQFSKKNWHDFFVITVRDILTTYILECNFDEVECLVRDVCGDIDISEIRNEFCLVSDKSKCLDPIYKYRPDDVELEIVYSFLKSELPRFTELLKTAVDRNQKDSFISLYQFVGNNVRSHGDALARSEISYEHVYSISDRINSMIKSLRNYNEQKNLKDYFAIDAFRNPIEVKFFQERYSAFYLWAINCPIDDRLNRLRQQDIPDSKISALDDREYPRESVLDSHSHYISQNIRECIQLSDVHISNQNDSGAPLLPTKLIDQVVRYVSLIQHPGLITPTRDERCMQVAFTAKLNSGCISRQVGAAVVDSSGYIRSVGWNDSPQKQTPCILRQASDLVENHDRSAFSDFEKMPEFKGKATQYLNSFIVNPADNGIPTCYCFKDLYDEKNQVHTRSLHAEENAFLALVGSGSGVVREGTLYTTASPCVLCAKKAYQLGVKRIVYIDPYPDRSLDHILRCGDLKPSISLFFGAVGTAYFRLYLPIVPLKDELAAYRGV